MASVPKREEVTNYIEDLYRNLCGFIRFTEQYDKAKHECLGIPDSASGFKRSSSELINIRDIFIHFILYHEALQDGLDDLAIEQWNCIKEHGQRAVKDQFVFFCQNILEEDLQKWLTTLESNGKYEEAAKATRRLLHDVKNIVLKIRISSARGIRINGGDISSHILALSNNHVKYKNEYYPIIREVCYSMSNDCKEKINE